MSACVDTDIFAIEIMFPRDRHFATNRALLEYGRAHRGKLVTTLLNKLELLGKASFGLSERQLQSLSDSFARVFPVKVLPLPEGPTGTVTVQDLCDQATELIKRKMALSDALILQCAEATPRVDTFITWNTRHFTGKTRLKVLTPEEFLTQ